MVEVDPIYIVVGTGVLIVLTTILICGKTLLSAKKLQSEPVTLKTASEKISKEETQSKPKKRNKKTVKSIPVEEPIVSAPAPAVKKVTLASVESAVPPSTISSIKAPSEKVTKEDKGSNGSSGVNGVHDKQTSLPSALKPASPPPSKPVAPSTESVVSLGSFDDSSSDEAWAIVKKPKKKPTAPTSTTIVAEETVLPTPVETIASSQPVAPTPAEPIDRVTEEVSVPAKKVGAIIGTKGTVKIAIQVATGTDIQFPKSTKESTDSTAATITGPAEGVRKAKKAIQDLISKGYSGLLEGEDFRETQVPVHHMYLPEIIGKGGANIRAIQEKLQVRVTVPQSSSSSGPSHNQEAKSSVKIGISGMKDNVIRAKALIKELIQYYHTEITHPGIVHEELEVPTSYYNYIIGAKGSEIKHIQANFKVGVHIPNLESINKNVVVVGLPANVESAKKYILKIIDNVINGVKKDSKTAKAVTAADQDTVDIVPSDLIEESKAQEVLFSDLLQGARHIQGAHIHMNSHTSSISHSSMMKPVVEEVSPVPIVDPSTKPQVPSVWNTGNTVTGATGGGMLAAGTTGVEW